MFESFPYKLLAAFLFIVGFLFSKTGLNAVRAQTTEVRFSLIILLQTQDLQDFSWVTTLEKSSHLRVTLAVSPDQFYQFNSTRAMVLDLVQKEKCELALRLSGDPPLPLIGNQDLARIYLPEGTILPNAHIDWSQELTGTIQRAKNRFHSYWGKFPEGFVPGGGSLSLPNAEMLQEQGFIWTAASFPPVEWSAGQRLMIAGKSGTRLWIFNADPLSAGFHQPITAKGGTRNTNSAATLKNILNQIEISTGMPSELVLDLAHSPNPLNVVLEELDKLMRLKKGVKMSLMREMVPAQGEENSSDSSQVWPYSWSWITGMGNPSGPGLLSWIGDAKKNLAWEILHQTRLDIETFQNSGKADIENLDRAMDEFHAAQSTLYLEWMGRPSAGAVLEREVLQKQKENEMYFKATLANVYRHMRQIIPAHLKGPMLSNLSLKSSQEKARISTLDFSVPESSVTAVISTGTVERADDPGFIKLSSSALAWTAADWQRTAEEKKNVAIKYFTIELIDESADSGWVEFGFKLNNEPTKPVALDLYIDINHRSGAGGRILLPGRKGFVSSRDGWEYVLSCKFNPGQGWDANLFREINSRSIYRSHSYKSSKSGGKDKEANKIYFAVPRQIIGSLAFQWGYLACLARNEDAQITDLLTPAPNIEELIKRMQSSSINDLEQSELVIPMMRMEVN